MLSTQRVSLTAVSSQLQPSFQFGHGEDDTQQSGEIQLKTMWVIDQL